VIQLERLQAAGISIVPACEITTHLVFERRGFAALVDREGAIGSAGLLTEDGFAALVWRGEQAWFVRKGWQREASPSEVSELRAFSRDLQQAIEAA
jgi:hypothetical protein